LPNLGGTGTFTATALEEMEISKREVENEWIRTYALDQELCTSFSFVLPIQFDANQHVLVPQTH
jgi:hypothetical protein